MCFCLDTLNPLINSYWYIWPSTVSSSSSKIAISFCTMKACVYFEQNLPMLHALLVLSISDSSDSTVSEIVMSNEGFFKVVCFRFPTNVFKKSNIFVFETKFIFEPKHSLSDFKILGPKAISFFSFQIFLRLQNVLFWF